MEGISRRCKKMITWEHFSIFQLIVLDFQQSSSKFSCSSYEIQELLFNTGPYEKGTTLQHAHMSSIVVDGVYIKRREQVFPTCGFQLWRSWHYHKAICHSSDGHKKKHGRNLFTTSRHQSCHQIKKEHCHYLVISDALSSDIRTMH